MRKCTARVWVKPVLKTATSPQRNGYWADVQGVFHQFGVTWEEFENGGCAQTTAIVEDIEGQVWEAEVSSLKFEESL